MQPYSAFAEIVLDGEKQELMLFGNRLKFFGNSSFLQDLPIYIGYAEVKSYRECVDLHQSNFQKINFDDQEPSIGYFPERNDFRCGESGRKGLRLLFQPNHICTAHA